MRTDGYIQLLQSHCHICSFYTGSSGHYMAVCFDGDSMVALMTAGRSAGSPAVPAESVLVEAIYAFVGDPVLTSLEIIIGQSFMRTDP